MALNDVKFVTTGPWGAGIARPLTAIEADGNINELKAAIQNLIDNPVAGVSVSNIAVVGRQVTFYMSDATTFGPFDLPISVPSYKGDWAVGIYYSTLDIVKVATYGTFMVMVDHTSVDPFDPLAIDGTSGLEIYQMIAPPSSERSSYVTSNTYNVTDADSGAFLISDHVDGLAVTLNPVAAETQISFRQGTDGPITFVDSTSAIIQGMQGYYDESGGRGSVVTCKYFDGKWFLFGRLAEIV